MQNLFINTQTFKQMFIQASLKVEEHIDELNHINVFPVADGDTGNNIHHTMHAIKLYISQNEDVDSLPIISKGIVRKALLESRGNSGTVISQFIEGFCQPISAFEVIDRNLLIDAFISAQKSATQSFQDPKEGTILDLFLDISNFLQKSSTQYPVVSDLFAKILEVAKESLNRTKFRMKLLEQSNVVDAGAAGMVYILEGFYEAITRNRLQTYVIDTKAMRMLQSQQLKYRYCLEIIIEGENINSQKILSQIRPLGDSIQIQDINHKLKLHIHTMEPQRIRTMLSEHGKLYAYKADDMQNMQEEHLRKLSHNFNQNKGTGIAFIVDTIADLPDKTYIEEDIYTLKIPIFVKTVDGQLDVDMDPIDFYDEMKQNPTFVPKTSKVTVGAYFDMFQTLSEQYEKVVCLTISSGISGSFESSLLAKSKLTQQQKNKIIVFDTKSASVAIKYFIEEFSKAYNTGLDLEEFAQSIDDRRPKIYFMVDDTVYLRRGGRLTGAKSTLSKYLKIQPVLTLNEEGKIIPSKQKALFKKTFLNLNFLVKTLSKSIKQDRVREIYIVYSDPSSKNYVDYVDKKLRQEIGILAVDVEIMHLPVSTVIGAHTGPGTVGVIYF